METVIKPGDVVEILVGEEVSGVPDDIVGVGDTLIVRKVMENDIICGTETGPDYWYYAADQLRLVKDTASTNPKQAYGDKKVPLQLCPPTALVYMALGMREGAEKYGAWNFRESDVEAMTYVGAIQRHLMAFVDGQLMDYDGKYPKPHLAGAMASLAILIDALEQGRLVDNRPRTTQATPRLLEAYKLP